MKISNKSICEHPLKATEGNGLRETANEWGRYGGRELVGRGNVTNDKCGAFLGYRACLNVKGHMNTLAGNFSGMVYVQVASHHCDRPSCPTCYRYGWSVKNAGKIRDRLAEASKSQGVVEHFILSPCKSDYGLNDEQLRAKAVKLLKARGIIGGVIVRHDFRYHSYQEFKRAGTADFPMGWYFSVHLHILGFLSGGYSRCRNCRKVRNSDYGQPTEFICSGCIGGFENVTRQRSKKDGWICKVASASEKRKSVFATAFYELNHASLKSGAVRPHIAIWFGTCSYRKMNYTPEKRKATCPYCNLELVWAHYYGKMKICKDMNDPNFHRHLLLPMDEGDGDIWVKAGAGDFG